MTPEQRVQDVIATLRMAGFELTAEEQALLRKQAHGQISADEAIQIVLRDLTARGIIDGYKR